MFNVIDTAKNKIAFRKVSAYEAHRMVDLLNSGGIVRFKAVRI